jgi:hypothetical protein
LLLALDIELYQGSIFGAVGGYAGFRLGDIYVVD